MLAARAQLPQQGQRSLRVHSYYNFVWLGGDSKREALYAGGTQLLQQGQHAVPAGA